MRRDNLLHKRKWLVIMSLHSSFPGQVSSEENIQSHEPGKNMNEQWLRCQLLKGMFSDEVAIKCMVRGKEFSVFVPKDFVSGEVDQEGKVRVMVFQLAGTSWAVLPSAQKSIIPINDHDLVSA
jgi:hypothetical protein